MTSYSVDHDRDARKGGIARYFVEHREVGWAALIAVMLLGWYSYGRLAQQEDPKIPERRAMMVTHFPGASAQKIELLVTKKLEKKIAEMQSIEEISSQSRNGVSIIMITLRSASQGVVDQEWDKLRSKVSEVALPEGCLPPNLDTDFGNTTTLLYAIASEPVSEGESLARAQLVQSRLLTERSSTNNLERAAVVAFYPPSISRNYRETLNQRFTNGLVAARLAVDLQIIEGESFAIADFTPLSGRASIENFLDQFTRIQSGTDGELHPDFDRPLVVFSKDDLLKLIRERRIPRHSYRQLEMVAETIEDEIKQIHSVGRVRKIGIVNETVYLLFSLATVTGYRLSPEEIMQAIFARNAIIPGGSLRTGGQNYPVQLSGEFKDEKELLGAIVGMVHSTTQKSAGANSAMPLYLRDIFEVRRGYENPIPYKVDVLRRNGGELRPMRAVLLAVEMKNGNIIGQFSESVNHMIDTLRNRLPDGIEVFKISDQPSAVSIRIVHFLKCFAEAVFIVIFVSLLLMDWRSATVVAAAIPLTIAMTLGCMHLFSIPLHQISIAALIISLGMLVDDPVVASDGINREMAAGTHPEKAAWLGPYRLRRPIFFATVINVVAFLPLVLLPSDKGAFIFALPAVVTLTLISSRIVSMTFIPLLGFYILKGQKGFESGVEVRKFFLFALVDKLVIAVLPRYKKWLEWGLSHPWKTVLYAYGMLLLSFGLTPLFGQQFFPPAERNQMLIDIELPESASINQTRQVCQQVASILQRHSEIVSAAVFSGGTSPRFYYNVNPREPGAFLAQALINTRTDNDVVPIMTALRKELDETIAARCLVKQLEQGPPVDSPIQIRLSGESLDTLRRLADRVAAILRKHQAYKVHDDLGRRTPTLQIDIDQERANSLGINNTLVGRLAQAAFTGLKVTEIREGDHLIPVMIRLRVEDRNEAEKIRTLYVESRQGEMVPLDNFAKIAVQPEYASIPHFNQLRAITVKGYSMVGQLPSAVLKSARRDLESLELPPGYKIDYVGEAKELRESQSEMGLVMAVSLSLIALTMILQFNSIIKSAVVMITVPLGLIGAFIGLAVTQSAFGFMALLGIVSLAGVIVSHIIVLSDFIEEARAEGMALKEALIQAGLVRLRAVLVTVLATVCGLIPLALTGGELWQPLTAVHIFGLLFATILTLVALPVLYFIFCNRLKWIQ